MVGRPPGRGAAAIGQNALGDAADIRDLVEDVRAPPGGLPPPIPDVPQISASMAVTVPSFIAPTLILAKADGRLPAIINSRSRSSISLTGLPVCLARAGADHSPFARVELRAKAAAHVLAIHANLVLRNLHLIADAAVGVPGDRLRRGPDEHLAFADLSDLAVRFQAAVGDHGMPYSPSTTLSALPKASSTLPCSRLAGLSLTVSKNFGSLSTHLVRLRLVFDLNQARRFFGGFFGPRSHRRDDLPGILDC